MSGQTDDRLKDLDRHGGRASVAVEVVHRFPALGRALVQLLRCVGVEAAHSDIDSVTEGDLGKDTRAVLMSAAFGFERVRDCVRGLRHHIVEVRIVLLEDEPSDVYDDLMSQGIFDERVSVHADQRQLVAAVAPCIPQDDRLHPIFRDGRRGHVGGAILPGLTQRELEVLRKLMEAKGNDAIASELGVSPHTVRTHLQNLFTKLDVGTRLEAAMVGFRAGLRPVEGLRFTGTGNP